MRQDKEYFLLPKVLAAVLLIGGGLQALQTATIVTGLPFAYILIVMCFSLYKGLDEDYKKLKKIAKRT
jgi:choline/glycine/proline betaine transport protein